MTEALKKTAPRNIILSAIEDLRKRPRDSSEYQSAYAYVTALDRAAVDVILDILAEEQDKAARLFLLELIKDIGKNQIALLGERLSDERWYFVRNIVLILGESKTEQAIAFLRKAADHSDIRIRREVIKALGLIGGKKAASVLSKFLRDQDAPDIQLTAIKALADFPGISVVEAKALVDFLEDRPLRSKGHELTLEAIKVLGKIGGRDSVEFLTRYEHIRWWKSRKLQGELKDAARAAMEEITKRGPYGGREQG